MPRRNKDGKVTTFLLVRSAPDGSLLGEQVDPFNLPPEKREELSEKHGAGQLRVENDDQVFIVITLDEAAHERVQTSFMDAAALAQEFMTPHRPYEGPVDE